jgi:hypothetical protein
MLDLLAVLLRHRHFAPAERSGSCCAFLKSNRGPGSGPRSFSGDLLYEGYCSE